MTVNINIDNRTVVRVLAVAVVFVLGLQFIRVASSALTLLIISSFLAMALNPPVTYLSSKITGGSRGLATGIAYLVVVALIGLFMWAMIPPLVTQVQEFAQDVPTYIDELSEGDDAISTFIRDNELDQEIEDYVSNFTGGDAVGSATNRVFTGLGTIGTTIVSFFTVLVLTFFMLVEGPDWLEKFWRMQPEESRDKRRKLGHKMYTVVTGYVNGQLTVALLAAMVSLVAMLFAGIPFPVPLAGLVGFLGLVPLIGATLGATVVVIVALFQSVSTAIAMAVFFLVYQQIENNFIQPIVQSRTLDMSPLLVFVAVLFGISIGGLLGALIAIPVAGMIRILAVDYIDHSQQKNSVTPKAKLPKLKRKPKAKSAKKA